MKTEKDRTRTPKAADRWADPSANTWRESSFDLWRLCQQADLTRAGAPPLRS
jgi:hypothetical protein